MNKNVDITNVLLKTEHLILRPFKETDLDDLYEYAKVDGVGQMAGWPPHKNKDESKFILNMFIEEKKTFAIVYNEKVIGSIGIEEYSEALLPELKDISARELGYVLAKDYWGQGLMPEACEEIIKYMFNDLKLDKIVCGHFKSNKQSKRVQEKLGFKYLKDYTYHTRMDTDEDAIINILDKKDWENEKK